MNKTKHTFVCIAFLFFSINTCFGFIQIDSIKTTASTCVNNGTATVFARSNSAALLYAIVSGPIVSPIQNSSIFNALYPGNYILRVYANNNDSADKKFVVIGNYQSPNCNPIPTNPICFGGNDGKIIGNADTLTGRLPYTWQIISPFISAVQSSDTFTNLIAGQYELRMYDSCDNFQTRTVYLNNNNSDLRHLNNFLGYDYIEKIGCDTMAVSFSFLQSIDKAGLPIIMTQYRGTDTIKKYVIPTLYVPNYSPPYSYFTITDTIPNITYNASLIRTIQDTCSNVLYMQQSVIPPFVFDIEQYYETNSNCVVKLGAYMNFRDNMLLHHQPFEYYLQARSLRLTVRDIDSNKIVQDTLYDSVYYSRIDVTPKISGRNYEIKITDECGEVWTRNYLWPVIAAPIVQYVGQTIGCIDSTTSQTYRFLNFKSSVTFQLTSGPKILGSTKPGYAYSDSIIYPQIFPNLTEFIILKGLTLGTYHYRAIDSCGGEVIDSFKIFNIEIDSLTTYSPLSDLYHSLSYKRGCLGANILYGNIHNSNNHVNGAYVTIKKIENDSIVLARKFTNIDSITSIPSGKYSVIIEYTIGVEGTAVNSNYKDCWIVYDTIEIPPYTLYNYQSSSTITCGGQIYLQLNADSTRGVAPFKYEVVSGPHTFPLQDSNTFHVNSYGVYTVRIIDACGNGVSQKVSVDSMKFQPVNKDGFLCVGNEISLSYPSSQFITYVWTKPNGSKFTGNIFTISPFSISDTGTYLIKKIVKINNCSDSFFTTYRLSLRDSIVQHISICQNDSLKVGNHFYSKNGHYIDTLKSIKGCDSIVITTLLVNTRSVDTIRKTLCAGDFIHIGNHIYTQKGNYIDTLQNVFSCDSIIYSFININTDAKDTTIENIRICYGDSVKVHNQYYFTSATIIDTFKNKLGCDSLHIIYINASGSTVLIPKTICKGDSIIVGNHVYKEYGFYTDSLINTSGCDSVVYTILKVVNGNSDTVFKQICVGDSVVLYNKTYKTEGFYTVLYSKGSTGCDSTIILKLSVMPLPLAGITASSDLVTPNTTVQLQTPFNSNYAYAWLPIDLISSSTIYNPTTQLTQNTWYYVNVTDRNNCKNKDSILIRVQQNNCDAEFFIPNAFSPNGDGINDIFRARYPCPVEEYYMIVYNRWGLKVFESNDINLGWDGRYNGEREQAEVYAFYVEYKPVGSAIKIAKKGNVTLLE